MKILKWSGAGLASFAEEFKVDLQEGPLSKTALFAIVGATGSGKSTLLDALCLALFGQTPRLDVGRRNDQNEMRDVHEGTTLSLGDPRQLLRRGMGSAWAEADFIGVGGKHLRARWHVRRARDKASGRLQSAVHTLLDLSTQMEHPVPSKPADAQAFWGRWYGLSYDQFCRSVLLPQGEFAAFLRSKSDERAQLLESLTGTKIYADISRLAHKQAAEWNRQEAEMDLALKGQVPLDPQAAQDLQKEIEAGVRTIEDLRLQLAELQSLETWWQDWERLKQESQAAQNSQQEALRAWQDLEPQRQKLQLSVQAEEARPLWVQWQKAKAECAQNQLEHQQRVEELPKSVALAQQAQVLYQEAEKADLVAQKAWEEASPRLAQAQVLDSEHQNALKLWESNKVECLARQQVVDEAQVNWTKVRDEESQRQHQLAQIQEQGLNDQNEGINTLAEVWELWADRLQGCHQGTQELLTLGQQIEQESEHLQSVASQIQTLESQDKQSQVELNRVKESLEQWEKRRMADNWSGMATALEEARQQAEHHQRVLALYQDWLVESQGVDQAQKDWLSWQELVPQRQDLYTRLDQKWNVLQAEWMGLRRSLGLEKALEVHLQEIRADLQEGEACPVCGALEHPFAQSQAWIQEAEALRLHRQKLAEDLVQVGQERDQALEQVNQALAQQQAARSTLQERSSRLEACAQKLAEQGYAELHPELGPQYELHCTQSAQKWAQLKSAFALMEEGLRALQLDQQTLNRQTEQKDLLHRELSAARLKHQAHETQLKHLRSSFDDLQKQISTTAEAWKMQFEAWPLGEWDKFANCLDLAVSKLAQRVQSWRALEEKRTALLHQAPALAERLEAASRTRNLAQTELERAQEQVKQAQILCEQKWADRIQVWPEADLRLAQEQLEQSLRQTAEARKTALEKWSESKTQVVLAQQRLDQALQQAHRSDAQLAQAQATLAQWIQDSGMVLDQPDPVVRITLWSPWMDLDLAWRISLQSTMEQAESACKHWEALVVERERILAQHQAQLPAGADLSPEDRLARQQELQSTLEQQTQICDANRALWLADQKMHERCGQLVAQKEELRLQAAPYRLLNDWIGSESGKKFQLYAQQFTLDLLVRQANAQLELINRRYRLDREPDSLTLVVVDRDMGNTRRPAQSLSGGESFLVSLGLALGLSSLSGARTPLESLFIDEGFGTLDSETLRMAMDALDALQSQGRKVGLITHVEELKERIPVQVRVLKVGSASQLRIEV